MQNHRAGAPVTGSLRLTTAMTAAVALAVTAAGALTGCSGAGSGPGVATVGGAKASASASAAADPDQQQLRFVQCMREHGIDMPDPEPGADGTSRLRLGGLAGVDRDKLTAAAAACRSLLPAGGALPSLNPQQADQMRAYAQCLREHGINVPDPDPQTGRIKIDDELLKLNPDDPAFKRAQEDCRTLRPNQGASASAGGGR